MNDKKEAEHPAQMRVPVILTDNKEKCPLSFQNSPSARVHLKYGDYTLQDMPGFRIERKRGDDFCRSISGKRRAAFFKELAHLRDDFTFARLIIITGSPAQWEKEKAIAKQRTGGRMTAAAITGTIRAINDKFIPVVQVETEEQAAAMIERWATLYYTGNNEQRKDICAHT